jgi:hypothetical protein
MGLLSTEQSDNFFETNSAAEAVQKKPPYFVLPSVLFCPAERKPASLTFGTAPLNSFWTGSRDVVPRRASAEGPLASLGATKK